MSIRLRHAGPIRDPLAGAWAESFLSPIEARVLRRGFGVTVDEADGDAFDRLDRIPPDENPGGSSSAPAALPMPPRRAEGLG